MGETKAYIASIIAVLLLILDANGWLKVPAEAVTIITTVLVGSRSLVGISKSYTAAKLVEGAVPTVEQQQAISDRLKT